MNSHLKSKPRRDDTFKYIGIIVLFCVIFILVYFLPGFFRGILYSVSRPVIYVKNQIYSGFSAVPSYFKSKSSQRQEILNLEEKIISLELKSVDYENLQKQNEELKVLLGRENRGNKILGRVLSKPPFSPYDTLLIDIGTSHGVSKGSKVYLSQGVIIGMVTEVTSKTSLVTLFSNGGESFEAVLSRTGASYELSGQGSGNFKLDVPKETDILWGDAFEYPSVNSEIIGNVYYIDSNSQSSFKTVYIRYPSNVFSSKWVFVENT